MQTEPWLRAGTANVSGSNGILSFTVLNPLATPSGDVDTIDVLTWMYGSDDLEFAMPQTDNGAQIFASSITDRAVFEEQCLDVPLNDIKFGNLAGAFSVPGLTNMGEKLTSVRQMIQKFALGVNNSTLNSSTGFGFYEPTAATRPIATSHMKHIGTMYLFSRGSVRYAALAYTDSTQTVPLDVYNVGIATSDMVTSTQYFGQLVVRSSTPNAMIQVPYYTPLIFQPTGLDAISTPRPIATCIANKAHTSVWYYAAGDDFMFGYLIPPPF
jgi:hypothetical protein